MSCESQSKKEEQTIIDLLVYGRSDRSGFSKLQRSPSRSSRR
jgi:hypothetical protein